MIAKLFRKLNFKYRAGLILGLLFLLVLGIIKLIEWLFYIAIIAALIAAFVVYQRHGERFFTSQTPPKE